jgi:Bacterial DNA-binding protein
LTAYQKKAQSVGFRQARFIAINDILTPGGSTMNKNDLISAVADASGLSKNDSANAVESVFDAITKALSGGDEVRLVGFGTFSAHRRADEDQGFQSAQVQGGQGSEGRGQLIARLPA